MFTRLAFLIVVILSSFTSVSHASPNCLIVGDSIGVGLSWHLKSCPAHVKVGLSSRAVLNRTKPARLLIISAGSNDARSRHLADNLKSIRSKAKYAIWILPRHKRAARIVRQVAKVNGDAVVGFRSGRDGVHPRSYKRLASDVKKAMQQRVRNGQRQ